MCISHSKIIRISAYASEPSEIPVYLCILSKGTEVQILWREVKGQPLYAGPRKHIIKIKALKFPSSTTVSFRYISLQTQTTQAQKI